MKIFTLLVERTETYTAEVAVAAETAEQAIAETQRELDQVRRSADRSASCRYGLLDGRSRVSVGGLEV